MTVYVLQRDPRKDFSDAKRFGPLKFLWGTNYHVHIDDAERRIPEIVEKAIEKLATYDPKKDFILFNGDPIGISAVSAILAQRWNSISALKWDNEHRGYYRVSINLLR